MRIRSLKYYFTEAVKSLFKNSLMTIASVVTVAACIFTVAFSFCIAVNLDYILVQIENSIGLTAFVDDSLKAEDVKILNDAIEHIPYIKSAKFITSDEALKNFGAQIDETGELFEGLQHENFLPRSFEIEVEDSSHRAEVVKQLKLLSGISSLKYFETETEILTAINRAIRVISLIVIVGLSAISIIIIMNTIKLTVNNRKNEINIMKYVGATDWFIRWPFIIEGILIGILGAIIPVGICWIGYARMLSFITDYIPLIDTLIEFKPGVEIFPILMPFSFLLGILIGAIGSITSMRKYLKV